MSGEQQRVFCPNCGMDDTLGTVEYTFAVSQAIITSDGKTVEVHHNGQTDGVHDDLTSVGYNCRACGWTVVNNAFKAADRVVRDSRLPHIEEWQPDGD